MLAHLFLNTWSSPRCYLWVTAAWQLASQRMRDPRGHGWSWDTFSDLALEIILSLPWGSPAALWQGTMRRCEWVPEGRDHWEMSRKLPHFSSCGVCKGISSTSEPFYHVLSVPYGLAILPTSGSWIVKGKGREDWSVFLTFGNGSRVDTCSDLPLLVLWHWAAFDRFLDS